MKTMKKKLYMNVIKDILTYKEPMFNAQCTLVIFRMNSPRFKIERRVDRLKTNVIINHN